MVDVFPHTASGDTLVAVSDEVDDYSCAPNTREWGPEVVYEVHVPSLGDDRELVIGVDDQPGDNVDIDLHLLSEANPDTCFSRDNTRVSVVVAPGETLYVVADTWTTSAGVELAGPYVLSFALVEIEVGSCMVNPIASCGDDDDTTPSALPIEAPGTGGCPAGRMRVSDFCVDTYEASLVLDNGGVSAPWSPFENPGNREVRAVSAAGGHAASVHLGRASSGRVRPRGQATVHRHRVATRVQRAERSNVSLRQRARRRAVQRRPRVSPRDSVF